MQGEARGKERGSVASWPRRTSTAAVATAQHALLAVHGELRGVSEGVGWCGVRRGCGGGFIARDAAYGGRSARRRPRRHGGDILPNPTRWCEGRGDKAFTWVRTCSRRSRPSAACRGAASWANLVDDGELATATVEGNRGEGRRNCPPLRRRGCRGTGARGFAARGGLGSAETATTGVATRRHVGARERGRG